MSADTAKGVAKSPDSKALNIKFHGVLWFSVLLLLAVFVASLAIGRYSVPFLDTCRMLLVKLAGVFNSFLSFIGLGENPLGLAKNWGNLEEAVVLTLRLPRTVAAIIIGAALALSGASYQSIFKNPMVSPDLLGVSSGACVGAAGAMLLSLGSGWIQLAAFAGGILAVAFTMSVPRLIRNESTTVLVLSGIIVGSLMGSLLSILKFVADTDTQLAEITYWTMGSFATINFSTMLPLLPTIVIPMIIILCMRFRLNILSLGDSEAKSLGINLRRTRGSFIICSTLLTASCVCMSGTIGWVGLVIPHVGRMLIGPDNKRMLPVAMLLGAIFMLIIDILCRTLTVAELRLGILTGIVGAPFFIFILIKQRRSVR